MRFREGMRALTPRPVPGLCNRPPVPSLRAAPTAILVGSQPGTAHRRATNAIDDKQTLHAERVLPVVDDGVYVQVRQPHPLTPVTSPATATQTSSIVIAALSVGAGTIASSRPEKKSRAGPAADGVDSPGTRSTADIAIHRRWCPEHHARRTVLLNDSGPAVAAAIQHR